MQTSICSLYFVTAAVASALLLSAVTAPCPSLYWTLRGDSCYRWFSGPQYWFDAEKTCISRGAHLASIGSEQENRLVGRMSQCRDAWIGRFATDVTRLDDPLSYSWTDGSDAARYERHNFSLLDTVHKPLIRTDGQWWLNSLYHERHPFVCEFSGNSTHSNASSKCAAGWSLFQDHCYLVPQFEANFNEANFYCQRGSAQLLSVLSESEQSYINRLIFGIGSCESAVDMVWIGLIKLNPCLPDSGGRELCYQWTDLSGKHLGFPQWENGHPNTGDWTVNCVTFSAGRMHSDSCHRRHRFVCKSPAAANDTDGGVESLAGVVAAFDFRRGLQNLVAGDTFIVRDDFGVPRSSLDGACFTANRSDAANGRNFYRIGEPVNFTESFLGQPQWTLFYRGSVGASHFTVHPVSVGRAIFNRSIEPVLLTAASNEVPSFDDRFTIGASLSLPENSTLRSIYQFESAYNGTTWCDQAVSKNSEFVQLFVNDQGSGRVDVRKSTFPRADFTALEIFLGVTPYKQYGSMHAFDHHCIRCFGIAQRQLNLGELKKAFQHFCPS